MKNKKGFTLVEVIVVLVILGILLAIAIPNVINYIDKANDKSDQLSARNVFLAAQVEAAEAYGKYRVVTPADIKPLVAATAGVTTTDIDIGVSADKKTITVVTYTGAHQKIGYYSNGTIVTASNS